MVLPLDGILGTREKCLTRGCVSLATVWYEVMEKKKVVR
jgi:hypothetical protein